MCVAEVNDVFVLCSVQLHHENGTLVYSCTIAVAGCLDHQCLSLRDGRLVFLVHMA